MSNLVFEFDWEDPKGARGPELRATWARLGILVNETPVTRLIDSQSRSVRESIYLPLYPLAEWLAMNWWNLLHEVELPRSERATSYEKRHSLRFAGEGFALPDLSIVPSGRMTELRWNDRSVPHARVSFIGHGCVSIHTECVRQELERFVSAVVSRLESENVAATPLQDEWSAIQSADPEERQFCEAAAALGEDPLAMDDGARGNLIDAASQIEREVLGEFLAATEGPRLGKALNDLRISEAEIAGSNDSLPALAELRRRSHRPDPMVAPWHQGYALARHLRGVLGLNGDLLADEESFARAIQCPPADFEKAVHRTQVPDWSFDAMVGPAADGNPVFLTAKLRPDSKRFAVCRALCGYLTGETPRSFALVSRSHSDRQKANRAFAAEFLAPESALRDRVQDRVIDEDQVDELAAEFGVSRWVIGHQIENHHIAQVLP